MFTSPLIAVPHGFTTREGGVSPAPYDSLNLGLSTSDDPALVEENRRLLLSRFGNPPVAGLDQVHGSEIHCVDGPGSWEGDGLLTDARGLLLRVAVADCFPILLHDPRQNIVGALHAGWRGVAKEILPKALRAMQTRYRSDPADIRLALGPGISGPRFQVGAEVAEQFRALGFESDRPDPNAQGKFLLDLEAVLRQQAAQNGIRPDHFWSLGLCTVSDPRFFSHRRDRGLTGRMWAVIGLPFTPPQFPIA